MTNILVVSSFWPTRTNAISGIFVAQQIAALCRAGCKVTVLVGKTVWKREERHLSPAELGLPADKAAVVEVPLVRMPEALSASAPAFGFNVRSVGLSVSRAVASLVRRNDVPQGCIVHGIDPFLSQPSVAGAVTRCLRRAQACIDTVALVGSPLRRHAADLGIDVSKTVVIPNGTELPALSDLPSETVASGSTLRIASVSNLIALKGIDDNIRALSLLKERHGIDGWRYSVIGDGPERERLEALAASLGLKEHIHFLGRVPYGETMREIAEADIFSLPSWGEAFGIVYLEAMARMRPAIGCLGNGAADIITDGQDGLLVPPKDPATLALAFKRLFDQPGLREALGRRARDTAEQYSWDVNARRVLDILQI